MYCGYITTLKGVRKHSNADRLQCVEVFGQTVIVDLSYKDGQKVVFFPADGQLSAEFAEENNLLRKRTKMVIILVAIWTQARETLRLSI